MMKYLKLFENNTKVDPLQYFLDKENDCPYYKNMKKNINKYIALNNIPEDFYREIGMLLYLYEEKNTYHGWGTYRPQGYTHNEDNKIKAKVKIYVRNKIIKKIIDKPELYDILENIISQYSSDGVYINKETYGNTQRWILSLFFKALKSKKLEIFKHSNKYNM